MKKESYIDITEKNNINNYKISYNCGEMYYFLKQFSMEDFEQVSFEEDVENKKDLTKITSVDEIISCTSSLYPDEKGLYHVEGMGIKFSPFIKAIQNENSFKGYDLIKPFEDTLLNLANFLNNENIIERKRKILLANYYFGLFDIKLNTSNSIEYVRKNIGPSQMDDFTSYLAQAQKNEFFIQQIEKNNVKVLKR